MGAKTGSEAFTKDEGRNYRKMKTLIWVLLILLLILSIIHLYFFTTNDVENYKRTFYIIIPLVFLLFMITNFSLPYQKV